MNDVVISRGENHEENLPIIFTYKTMGFGLSITTEEWGSGVMELKVPWKFQITA